MFYYRYTSIMFLTSLLTFYVFFFIKIHLPHHDGLPFYQISAGARQCKANIRTFQYLVPICKCKNINFSLWVFFPSIDARYTHGHVCQLVNDAKEGTISCKNRPITDGKMVSLFATKDNQPGEELLYDYRDSDSRLWWRSKIRYY